MKLSTNWKPICKVILRGDLATPHSGTGSYFLSASESSNEDRQRKDPARRGGCQHCSHSSAFHDKKTISQHSLLWYKPIPVSCWLHVSFSARRRVLRGPAGRREVTGRDLFLCSDTYILFWCNLFFMPTNELHFLCWLCGVFRGIIPDFLCH